METVFQDQTAQLRIMLDHMWTVFPNIVGLVLGLSGLGVLLLCLVIWRQRRRLSALAQEAAADRLRQNQLVEAQRHTLEAQLAQMQGSLQTLTEQSVTRQAELSRTLDARLDRVSTALGDGIDRFGRSVTDNLNRVSSSLGQDLSANRESTGKHLSELSARLAVIDAAQRNIAELTGQVMNLQDIFTDKQARGAFGQERMEAIIADGLPRDAYSFQATLSNGRRPDCLVHLPNAQTGIAIDAKFPLEAFEALRKARGEADQRQAASRLRRDIGRHITHVAERYLIPGETQETVILFVPSESLYAELHEHFPDILQNAHRHRVMVVSPNLLMLAVQTMRAIIKDVRMREEADLIQAEVGHLIADLDRLRGHVVGLERHFSLAAKAVENMHGSMAKIAGRGKKIGALDFGAERKPMALRDRDVA